MYNQQGPDAYRTSDAHSMPKEKMIVALYERMVSDLEEAEEAIAAQDRLKMIDRVNHSQRIVVELRNSLDHNIGGDISRNLESLYDYLFQEHLQLIVSGDPLHVANCISTITPLLEAWRQIPVGTCDRAQRQRAQDKLKTPIATNPAIVSDDSEEKAPEHISVSV